MLATIQFRTFCTLLLSKNVDVKLYESIIFPVVLYGCETWPVTLRDQHTLRVVKKKVLRKVFGHNRDEITGDWKNAM
jgi:hypothetical protein